MLQWEGSPGSLRGLKVSEVYREGGASYRQVSLVDSQEEDQLSQAQGGCQVATDAMLIGAQGTKKGEEEEGEQQGSQGDPQGHVCQCLQWQDLSILQGRRQKAKGMRKGRACAPSPGSGLPPPAPQQPAMSPTSLRDTSMSTAKLVMWLHWQLTWLSLRKTTSQPRADQPPVPLTLCEKG